MYRGSNIGSLHCIERGIKDVAIGSAASASRIHKDVAAQPAVPTCRKEKYKAINTCVVLDVLLDGTAGCATTVIRRLIDTVRRKIISKMGRYLSIHNMHCLTKESK